MGEFYFRHNRDGFGRFAAQMNADLASITSPHREWLQSITESPTASVEISDEEARGLAALVRDSLNRARAFTPEEPIACPLDGNHTGLYFDRDGNVTDGPFRDNDDPEFGEPIGGARRHDNHPPESDDLETILAKLVERQPLTAREIVKVILAVTV